MKISHTKASPILIVADLHGDLNCDTVIFLGDYTDPGPAPLEVLERLFSMKIDEPGNIILLRGNHELRETNRFEGLFRDLDHDEDLYTRLNQVFDTMPVAAVISDKIFCVHGGIPGSARLSDIAKSGVYPYVWNDPSEENGINRSSRGLGMRTFCEEVLVEFLQLNGLERMIRGHSVVDDGYRWWFGEWGSGCFGLCGVVEDAF